jgi:hypothetical protein
MSDTNLLFCSEYIKRGGTLISLNCFAFRKLRIDKYTTAKGQRVIKLSSYYQGEMHYICRLEHYQSAQGTSSKNYKFSFRGETYILCVHINKAYLFTLESYFEHHKSFGYV